MNPSPDTQSRLLAARQRLQTALVTGDNTGPHRDAIRQLEEAQAADAQRLYQAAAEAAERDGHAIAQRATEITAATLQAIAADVARFEPETITKEA